jgi:hypothetical protein
VVDQNFLWAIVVEGTVDRFCGRPQNRNPYAAGSDSAEAWDYGWAEADETLELRGQQEAARWLTRAQS